MSLNDIRVDNSSNDDDEKSEERNSIYFSTIRSRHSDHLFKDLTWKIGKDFKNSSQKSIIRYLKFEEINPTKIRQFPSLILSRLSFSSDLRTVTDKFLLRLPILRQEFYNISFELSSGDIMGIMYTKESEIYSLFNVLSGFKFTNGKISGEILINGHRMRKDRLAKTIAFVSSESPNSCLTLRQYLYFHAKFSSPVTKRYGGINHSINKIIKDLGLSPVCDIVCNRLSNSHWQRAKVAAQLIRDPIILLIGDILKDVDIHDQCFLIDYLREWAIKTSRIVIMAISPPSIEVFKMFSKVLVMSSGRVVFHGSSSSMQEYFESIGCPCPPFKNICDYYVDIVTHDNLTSDASRESSIRISRLVNLWTRKAPPIPRVSKGKVLLNITNENIFSKTFGILFLLFFDFWNNFTARILFLFMMCIISTGFSICFSEFSSNLPQAYFDRQLFMDFTIFYVPAILGIILIKRHHHLLKQFRSIQLFSNCSCSLFVSVTVFGSLPTIFLISLILSLPPAIFIDFHKNLPNFFFSLFTINFMNISTLQNISSMVSFFDSISFAIFCLQFLWICFYFTTGINWKTMDILKIINPLIFQSTQLFKLLYEEKTDSILSSNLSHPIKLFSCGKTILNSTQLIKGPCQKVRPSEILAFYNFQTAYSNPRDKLYSENMLIIFILINFTFILLSILIFNLNRIRGSK